ncbi:MAG: penicillin-binding protein 1C [Bacteroidota bacterium]
MGKRVKKVEWKGNLKQKRTWVLFLLALCVLVYAFGFPKRLFQTPYSTLVYDRHGALLDARIADDGQWRFPPVDSVPDKFTHCLLRFEDKRFFWHPGVDPLSIGRALKQNLKAGSIVSGGSTLTMQLIRLSRKDRPRNLWQKGIETILATRAEWRYSKEEILALYAAHAPFGGNVVGLRAAAWRYYGIPPHQLTWGQAATLAVLPNAPALIHPGRNRKALRRKRNNLLKRLQESGTIATGDYELAVSEPLPEAPKPLPHITPHATQHLASRYGDGKQYVSTLDKGWQTRVAEKVRIHQHRLQHNHIHNAAALIVEVKTGNVLAYVGNIPAVNGKIHENQVDIITSLRSTGSLLKPMLYASMLSRGELLPTALVADLPTTIAGYSPQNFTRSYDGAVSADEALYRSLNIPMVRMLQEHGLEVFQHTLQQAGISSLNKPANHYGLTLILGGGESSLWELTGVYAAMARNLGYFTENNARYPAGGYHPPKLIDTTYDVPKDQKQGLWDAGALFTTFEALTHLNRPEQERGWQYYASNQKIAWKTGTSFGFRDGWAIGVTPDYAVGVWTGNADGEGRPGLTGLSAAAPLMFDIFKLLPTNNWFATPHDALTELAICSESGYRAGPDCPHIDTLLVPTAGRRFAACPFHRRIHLDQEGYRVNSSCYPPSKMQHTSWFVLPPAMAWYYQQAHPDYRPLPPWRADCESGTGEPLQLIYPTSGATLFLPVDFDGNRQQTVFQAAHNQPDATVYWYVDANFVGKTTGTHEISLPLNSGEHTLTLMDSQGHELSCSFSMVTR